MLINKKKSKEKKGPLQPHPWGQYYRPPWLLQPKTSANQKQRKIKTKFDKNPNFDTLRQKAMGLELKTLDREGLPLCFSVSATRELAIALGCVFSLQLSAGLGFWCLRFEKLTTVVSWKRPTFWGPLQTDFGVFRLLINHVCEKI